MVVENSGGDDDDDNYNEGDDDEEDEVEDLALDGTSNPSQSKQSSALATSIIQWQT